MGNYKVVADPLVKNDLIEARDFLESRRKGYGLKFIQEYKSLLNSLKINPTFQNRYKEIHCLPMLTFKYMIHFKIVETTKTVIVYAVLSNYVDPKSKWL